MEKLPEILIVDDDEGMRFFLEEALRKEGFGCVTASDGREALDVLEDRRPPIVLMDVKMPKLGGLPATEEIRKRFPDVLVILMTAFGSRAVALDAVRKGE